MPDLPSVEFHRQALIETLELRQQGGRRHRNHDRALYSGRHRCAISCPRFEAKSRAHRTGKDESAYAAFEKRIVTDRNKVLAGRKPRRCLHKARFIAVGALHLPGDEGLVELIRNRALRAAPSE
jgi:hypothetical protein